MQCLVIVCTLGLIFNHETNRKPNEISNKKDNKDNTLIESLCFPDTRILQSYTGSYIDIHTKLK